MQVPAERYAPSSRPYRVLGELDYPLQDWTATVTHRGRICYNRRKINLSYLEPTDNPFSPKVLPMSPE